MVLCLSATALEGVTAGPQKSLTGSRHPGTQMTPSPAHILTWLAERT